MTEKRAAFYVTATSGSYRVVLLDPRYKDEAMKMAVELARQNSCTVAMTDQNLTLLETIPVPH
jgi:hypothetical protein